MLAMITVMAMGNYRLRLAQSMSEDCDDRKCHKEHLYARQINLTKFIMKA